MNWYSLAEKSIKDTIITKKEALSILEAQDSELLKILDAVYLVRKNFFGNKVRIHILLNAKSGLCSEDCAFCSQSSIAKTPIKKYPILSKGEIIESAYRAKESRAYKFCIATSTRAPSKKELDILYDAVKEIKKNINIKICVSLGLLTEEKARKLKEAGVDKFNHNLETSERFFSQICTTHKYQDRINTIEIAKSVGLEICSGGLIGTGEEDIDIVDLAFALHNLDVDSIPINFLDPRPGTPLEKRNYLTPQKCLKVLAMFRFINPTKDIRIAGGREVNLRSLQPLALYAVNSIFTNGYLTTKGQTANEDYKMIKDTGFEIEEPIEQKKF